MHGRNGRIALGGLVALALGALAPAAQADINAGTAGGLTYMVDGSGPRIPAPSVVSADAACPTGLHVVGGGMAGSDTFDVSVQFWLNRTRPFDGPDGDTAPDDGWRGRGFNRFGSNKRGVVIAVCSRATVRYANGRASAPAGSAASARAACPAGMHVAGGGAGLSGSATEAFINTSFPYDSNDADRRPDDGWKARAFNQGGPEKVLTVHAACVRALPRYVLASSTSSVQAVAPMCPDRTYGMGGGGVVAGPADRAFVSGIAPFGPESSPPDGGFATLFSRTDAGARYTGVSVCKT